MFDQIVKLSIKNRWLVLIIFLFIGAFGVYNYFKLPIDAVPDITNVQVQINSEAQGLSPTEMESQVTYPIETALAVKEAQNRVKSMVLIHQKLYSKEQLIGIDSKEYIEDLVNDIIENQTDTIPNLTTTLSVESTVFSIDSITPLGLIINELITNCIKHAFPSSIENPKIELDFYKQGEMYVLKVIDIAETLMPPLHLKT